MSDEPDADLEFFIEQVQKVRHERTQYLKTHSRPLSLLTKPSPSVRNTSAPGTVRAHTMRLGLFNPLSVQRTGRLQFAPHHMGRHPNVFALVGTQANDRPAQRESTYGFFLASPGVVAAPLKATIALRALNFFYAAICPLKIVGTTGMTLARIRSPKDDSGGSALSTVFSNMIMLFCCIWSLGAQALDSTTPMVQRNLYHTKKMY